MINCPECGMDYEPEFDLVEGTVYVCDHCKTECVPGGINGLLEYWGEFWDEDTGDIAPRVRLTRDRGGHALREMFTASMQALAGLNIRGERG